MHTIKSVQNLKNKKFDSNSILIITNKFSRIVSVDTFSVYSVSKLYESKCMVT